MRSVDTHKLPSHTVTVPTLNNMKGNVSSCYSFQALEVTEGWEGVLNFSLRCSDFLLFPLTSFFIVVVVVFFFFWGGGGGGGGEDHKKELIFWTYMYLRIDILSRIRPSTNKTLQVAS